MQDFFQRYFDKLDLTTILENLLTKVISLLILFLLFYIAKKMLHATVRKIVKPSLKFSNRDAGRQKTISRLLENVFNYILYFFLLYCILSIFYLMSSMASSFFLNASLMWVMKSFSQMDRLPFLEKSLA